MWGREAVGQTCMVLEIKAQKALLVEIHRFLGVAG